MICIMQQKLARKELFFDKNGINILEENVFFEVTKEEKIDRIESLGCTHFIDDLQKFLRC